MSVFDWSTTAADNDDADSNINWAEGQAPSTVNDSARAEMARIAHWRNMLGANVTMGGTGNAYTYTTGETLTAYSDGIRLLWQPNADPTGAVTLNVDTIGAKKVYMPDGTQAGNGELDADSLYDIVYDSSLDSSNGAFKIVGFPDTTLTAADYLTAANNLSDLASASAARSNLGLGTMAVEAAADYAALSGATFTGAVSISAASPLIKIIETDASADNGKWRWSGSAENLFLQTLNDAESAAANAIAVTRTGTTVDQIQVYGSSVYMPGDVGIGTASPEATTHIREDVSGSNDALLVHNRNASGVASIAFVSSSFDYSDSRYAQILSGGGGSNYIAFATGNGGAPTEAVRIDSSGNVGIGTSSPGATLDVDGDMIARAAVSSETSGTLTANSANRYIIANGNITLPASVFSQGDIIIILANGGTSRTITRGSGLTMYVGNTNSASGTLAGNGIISVFFRSATACVVSGDIS